MSAEVRTLRLVSGPADPEPDPEIVEALEKTLAEAKAGRVKDLVLAYSQLHEDRHVAMAKYAGNAVALLSHASRLAYQINRQIDLLPDGR